MFIQVIQGRVAATKEELRASLDRWHQELAPGAQGWLGTTAGVTDDDRFICLARFESRDAARRNSGRPEQHQWWMETAKLFSGDVAFHDCEQVIQYGPGGSDDAGFVQVMQGRLTDVQRAVQLLSQQDDTLARVRPDLIGSISAIDNDGVCTDAAYFTSEQEAREGERKELPPEAREQFQQWQNLFEGGLAYFDLREPWLYSPR
ncbi:hypothetical protein [Thermoactinospora rubra]|uniref:hypothetical protein n=1 Tax=Thermoactinospora rubra TaxID=1088767 RepID=UPI000A1176A8|nr:hypothetical protein [Thermoactinospora rubra]